MKKKIYVISGIVLMMLITSISTIVVAEPDDEEILGRTKITAIGTFSHCNEDKIVYGHIFIGFRGNKPVFNLNIEIYDNTIFRIVMTNHFIHCVVSE